MLMMFVSTLSNLPYEVNNMTAVSSSVESILKALHYLHPPIIILSYLIPLTHQKKTLPGIEDRKGCNRQSRCAALSLMFLLALSYIMEVMVYLYHSAALTGWWLSQHNFLHAIASVLVWSALHLNLLGAAGPSYHRSWILSCLFESIFCVLATLSYSQSQGSRYDTALLSLQIFRLICSIVLGLFTNFQIEQTVDGTDKGTMPSGDKAETLIEKRQRERLQEQGLIDDVKEFRIFLPCFWPSNKKEKLCFVVVILDLVTTRFLRVWMPQQLGIIMDQFFAKDFDNAHYEVAIWVLLSWLRDTTGPLGVMEKWARMEIKNSSRQKVCRLAFEHVMTLSWDFHINKESAEIIQAVEQGSSIFNMAELFLLDTIPVVIDVIVAIWYTTSLTDSRVFFTILLVCVSYVYISIRLTNWTQPLRRTSQETSQNARRVANESLKNWRTVSLCNRVNFEIKRYDEAVLASNNAEQAYDNRMNMESAIGTLIIFLGLLSVSLLATPTSSSGEASIGSFVTLVTFWETIVYPLQLIAWSYSSMTSTFIEVERLFQLLRTKPSVSDGSNKLEVSAGRVEFCDVQFSYNGKEKNVINGISFEATPGMTVFFVGQSGAGKSTILNLICRLFDVTRGSIRIDGQDIRDVTFESLRKAVGFVPQEIYLPSGTILENVRYSRPDATEEDVIVACKGAALHDDILSLADKYNTQVDELSGGQRQRVAIARMLLKEPKIVILDEPTSAIDPLTEAEVQKAFKELRSERTTFVVAHRLSIIMEADLILFIEDGNIIESGTHQELLNKKGKYFEFWRKEQK
jgi:ABC-type multidrug transport system fused ATPase/permease subunit